MFLGALFAAGHLCSSCPTLVHQPSIMGVQRGLFSGGGAAAVAGTPSLAAQDRGAIDVAFARRRLAWTQHSSVSGCYPGLLSGARGVLPHPLLPRLPVLSRSVGIVHWVRLSYWQHGAEEKRRGLSREFPRLGL